VNLKTLFGLFDHFWVFLSREACSGGVGCWVIREVIADLFSRTDTVLAPA
jgi:hypothetical protein